MKDDKGRRGRCCGLDSELLHARDQRRSLDAQAHGRPLWTGNTPFGLFEDARDFIAIVEIPVSR